MLFGVIVLNPKVYLFLFNKMFLLVLVVSIFGFIGDLISENLLIVIVSNVAEIKKHFMTRKLSNFNYSIHSLKPPLLGFFKVGGLCSLAV